MLTAQMQTLETHPDFTHSISIGIGSYHRTAELHNGTWQGHDLTHHFDDNRSSLRYSEPARPSPMAPLQASSAPVNIGNKPPMSLVTTQQFTCLLPAMPPPMLASTSASASTCIRRPLDNDPHLMLPSTFSGEGVEEAEPMGKEVLQKTKIALFMDSTMKATANMNNTLMDVPVMNLPCSSLEEMAEVTCKVFGPTANHSETIPFPPILIYSNVIGHLALRGTVKHFEGGNRRLTEAVLTGEVVAYIETMRNVIGKVQRKKPTVGVIFVSPPGYIYLPLPLQQLLYLLSEAAHAQNLHFYIVAPNLRVSAMTWRPCENSYSALLAEVSKALQAILDTKENRNCQPMMPPPSTLGCKWHTASLTIMECAVTETQTNTRERT